MHANKAKQGIHSLLPIGRQVFSHLQESRAPSRVTVTWEDKRHHAQCPPPSFFFPQLIYWAWRHMVWNSPLASLGQLSWLCPLPASCASGRAWNAKKSLASINITQQQLKHQCVINIILMLNPKHSTIPATKKKINSIPAKTSTPYCMCSKIMYCLCTAMALYEKTGTFFPCIFISSISYKDFLP